MSEMTSQKVIRTYLNLVIVAIYTLSASLICAAQGLPQVTAVETTVDTHVAAS
ncbi:MAG: hypothetical protein GY943_27860 [Chloroflexi bacterium]|nr:hypothetical protein [Chloroflexota bacterium]